MDKSKFGTVDNNNNVTTYKNKNCWYVKEYDSFKRITIAPEKDEVELLLRIVKGFTPPLRVLYVLFRPGHKSTPAGRYHSRDVLTYDDIEKFCMTFRDFFETDGRHHLWIIADNNGIKKSVILDNHHLLHVFDDVERIKSIMQEMGFSEEVTSVPEPHVHFSNPENDRFEKELLDYWNWIRVPFKHRVKGNFTVQK